jgi:hypothetical protein
MATQQTDFGQYLNSGQARDAYAGVTAVETATNQGDYEANAKNLKKPWTLPISPRPINKQIG